jgi:hypothetical protein
LAWSLLAAPPEERSMLDGLMVVLVVTFFAMSQAYVAGCDGL